MHVRLRFRLCISGSLIPYRKLLMALTLPSDCNSKLLLGFDYWQKQHHPDGRLPGRQDIDPVDLRSILACLCLYDVQADPLRFRYRLIGTDAVAKIEEDFTGRWLDEVHPTFKSSDAYADFTGVSLRRQPLAYYRGPPLFHTYKKYVTLERLLLPLARDGNTVDMMLAINVYHPASRAG